jgi:hypothetical protein
MSATATAARSKDRSSSATQKFFRKLHLNHGKNSNVAQQQDTVQQQNIKPNKQTKGKKSPLFSYNPALSYCISTTETVVIDTQKKTKRLG